MLFSRGFSLDDAYKGLGLTMYPPDIGLRKPGLSDAVSCVVGLGC